MNDRPRQLDATPDSLRSAFESIAPSVAQEAQWREAMRGRQATQTLSHERVPWIWVGASAAAAVLAIASTLIVPLSSQDFLAGAEQPLRVIRTSVESTFGAPVNDLLGLTASTEMNADDPNGPAMMSMSGESMSMGSSAAAPTGGGFMPHIPMVRFDWLTEPFESGWSMVKPLFESTEPDPTSARY